MELYPRLKEQRLTKVPGAGIEVPEHKRLDQVVAFAGVRLSETAARPLYVAACAGADTKMTRVAVLTGARTLSRLDPPDSLIARSQSLWIAVARPSDIGDTVMFAMHFVNDPAALAKGCEWLDAESEGTARYRAVRHKPHAASRVSLGLLTLGALVSGLIGAGEIFKK